MLRVLSALVLLPAVVAVVWLLPITGTIALLGLVTLLAFLEYAAMARQVSAGFPHVIAGSATLATYAAVCAQVPLELVLFPALAVTAAAAIGRGRPSEDVLRLTAVALLPILYLALPMGLAFGLVLERGPLALLVPFFTIVASDSAQYYGGRALGRRPLAPAISPKKTVEGAVCGIVAAGLALPLLARPVLPEAPAWLLVVVGVLLALAGIAGDLFESLLKRSTGIKDSSGLIPGHGGMLDRIDALLFACPAFYLFLVYGGG